MLVLLCHGSVLNCILARSRSLLRARRGAKCGAGEARHRRRRSTVAPPFNSPHAADDPQQRERRRIRQQRACTTEEHDGAHLPAAAAAPPYIPVVGPADALRTRRRSRSGGRLTDGETLRNLEQRDRSSGLSLASSAPHFDDVRRGAAKWLGADRERGREGLQGCGTLGEPQGTCGWKFIPRIQTY
jgi:hypothetical protein